MSLPALREKAVGPFTVRELTMRAILEVQRTHPEADNARVTAMLGAAVFNGSATPLGDAVLDLGASTYNELLEAFVELNGRPESKAEDAPGNV